MLLHKSTAPTSYRVEWIYHFLWNCSQSDFENFSSNRASYRNNYNEEPETEEYYDYEEDKEVGEDGYSYDNLTHLADYLETASSSERNLNPLLSLAALLLFVFLSESEAVFWCSPDSFIINAQASL